MRNPNFYEMPIHLISGHEISDTICKIKNIHSRFEFSSKKLVLIIKDQKILIFVQQKV